MTYSDTADVVIPRVHLPKIGASEVDNSKLYHNDISRRNIVSILEFSTLYVAPTDGDQRRSHPVESSPARFSPEVHGWFWATVAAAGVALGAGLIIGQNDKEIGIGIGAVLFLIAALCAVKWLESAEGERNWRHRG
jgi:hypothetical protein